MTLFSAWMVATTWLASSVVLMPNAMVAVIKTRTRVVVVRSMSAASLLTGDAGEDAAADLTNCCATQFFQCCVAAPLPRDGSWCVRRQVR